MVLRHPFYHPHGITVKFPHPYSNYRDYCGITTFPVTVSSSGVYKLGIIILHWPLCCISVIVYIIPLPYSADQPHVLWSSRQNRARICGNGHFSKALLSLFCEFEFYHFE